MNDVWERLHRLWEGGTPVMSTASEVNPRIMACTAMMPRTYEPRWTSIPALARRSTWM